ncbi:MAG TPA: GNAT family N-acetyltransferase [Actinomycetota bacterium]|nr:GNAT family N-acetyltransferase [Actinomycetota bacterium]
MPSSGPDVDLLRRIDAYLDATPRTAARAEPIGPFTLFVGRGDGWQYYARPTPGTTAVDAADVRRVLDRQRRLRVPHTFEWIADLVPGLAGAAVNVGLEVTLHPLMVLDPGAFPSPPSRPEVDVRVATVEDDLATLQAVAQVAFGAPGTAIGRTGAESLPDAAISIPAGRLAFVYDRVGRGVTVTAAAYADGVPVSVGNHQPVGDATEIVGVGTLPAFRRRGFGAAVTARLVQDAVKRGAELIFLSAGDEVIARVYAGLGFRVVGSAGAAEPSERAAR